MLLLICCFCNIVINCGGLVRFILVFLFFVNLYEVDVLNVICLGNVMVIYSFNVLLFNVFKFNVCLLSFMNCV